MTRFLLVAGDPSGDLYGSMLMRTLRSRRPEVRFHAAGGPLMRQACEGTDRFHHDLASEGTTGFVEPARRLPTFLRLLGKFRRLLRGAEVDALVCIDYYGFNRRVLAEAKSAGIPSFYYISPQVWASRPGRIRQIRRCVDRMLVIFPFEEPLYREARVPVTWVGHPLLDLVPSAELARRDFAPLRLGLLPGSRPGEIRRHLPLFLEAASRIRRDYPDMEVTVFGAKGLGPTAYAPWLARTNARLVFDEGYSERRAQHLVLTSSGTATVENALLGLPMVVVYKLSWPTYLLARAIIRVKHIAMANILLGRRAVPELIQHHATPQRVAHAALDLLANPRRLQALRAELAGLRSVLGGPGATGRAADILLT
ncbi:MAG: lipid-A-disaccharide synthase [Elusimicrobiota bacterium]